MPKISKPARWYSTLLVENIGIFVVEVKSHDIKGIRSFENNVPQVVYEGSPHGDKDLLDQPHDFAYDLRSQVEKLFGEDADLPPLYYAGWLPNVTPEQVAALPATVDERRVWLSDMLERATFEARLPKMKNITRGLPEAANRSSLESFCKIFGTTSGLRNAKPATSCTIGSIGHLIDRKNQQLKRLTKEQETLAFSPNLTKGPKVIRGVAGSGKTIVLANAVAETLLRARSEQDGQESILDGVSRHLPNILVLCYNRALAPYLEKLIANCFDCRKPVGEWVYPARNVTVANIDRYAYKLTKKVSTSCSIKQIV